MFCIFCNIVGVCWGGVESIFGSCCNIFEDVYDILKVLWGYVGVFDDYLINILCFFVFLIFLMYCGSTLIYFYLMFEVCWKCFCYALHFLYYCGSMLRDVVRFWEYVDICLEKFWRFGKYCGSTLIDFYIILGMR